jgi:hypothetical protein
MVPQRYTGIASDEEDGLPHHPGHRLCQHRIAIGIVPKRRERIDSGYAAFLAPPLSVPLEFQTWHRPSNVVPIIPATLSIEAAAS